MQELDKILEEIEDEAIHNPEVGRKQCEGMVRAMNIIRKHLSRENATEPMRSSQDEWIPVEERLPKPEEEVFIQTERGTRTTAIYEDGTVREEDSIWHWCDIDGEWDEERDCMIIPKGWWEDRRFNPDDVYNNVVDEKVLAWRPLPPNYCANSKNIECEIEGEKDGFI